MSEEQVVAMFNALIEDDFQVIFNSDSGHAYLHDILSYVYGNLSETELRDEITERGINILEND